MASVLDNVKNKAGKLNMRSEMFGISENKKYRLIFLYVMTFFI